LIEHLKPFESERLVKNWLGPWLWIFCLDPEDTKIILNSPDCLKKPRTIYSAMFDFGLISINGEEYKAHRKAITPLFTLKALKSFLPLIDGVANEFLVDFDKRLTGDSMDISHDTLDYALNATLVTFLGAEAVEREVRWNFLENAAG
jgi:cytochrome P450